MLGFNFIDPGVERHSRARPWMVCRVTAKPEPDHLIRCTPDTPDAVSTELQTQVTLHIKDTEVLISALRRRKAPKASKYVAQGTEGISNTPQSHLGESYTYPTEKQLKSNERKFPGDGNLLTCVMSYLRGYPILLSYISSAYQDLTTCLILFPEHERYC